MSPKHEKTIFFEALEIESPRAREAFVQGSCQGDPELLNAVSRLLAEHDRADNPIDHPVVASLPTFDAVTQQVARSIEANHPPGTMVGPYKLMEQIGEGGCGLVFVADQQVPVRRRVALKIIKPGMETRQVIARFEAERQALAMMDHENIARVFDAGVTQTGQPYFVMELVRGVPLNEFCDNHRLDTRQRLELFLSICNAVQHAHQKGIIHRDLKPSNVLVTLQDGRPIAKVIDFGIVKAIGQSLTDKTIYTRLASMIGTPAYMSPEQAEMSNVDVDTRSDIYSLGVLLYELLTGSTPFVVGRLNSVGFDELRRIIREEEPPSPSTRLSTLGNQLSTTVSANRRLEPAKLTSLMRGDLDWIVMKAIDKDRARRYPSAIALAQDVSRFLEGQPVEARPPSTLYRFSKFARRNKVALTTVSLVAGALVLGTVVSLWQARVAYHAMEQARIAAAAAKSSNAELEGFTDRLRRANTLIASGRAYADAGDWSNANEAFTNATQTQPRYFHAWMERGSLYAKMGLWEMAASDYRKALELGSPVDGVQFLGVPQLFDYVGDHAMYEQLAKDLAQSSSGSLGTILRGQLVDQPSAEVSAQLAVLGEQLLEERRLRPDGRPTRTSRIPRGPKLYVAGWAHLRNGDIDRAIERLEESLDESTIWPASGINYPLLAIAYTQAGRSDDAAKAWTLAKQSRDQWLDQSIETQQGTPPIPWFDWIEFLMNYREASLRLTGELPPDDPRLDQLKSLARGAIANSAPDPLPSPQR
ncbi:serine/threonine-protein kinase [Rosistilla oblonga]|uniref:Serine/threonine-protein kinase PknB n=1 Tax=Rosistilla oblonga TaxID=2527990 RepID=A0A518IZU9_9BACT|nr:serine/threonine-protein kinase [Rosistilla oblonga]QDV58619.1 Serine/threonine-protein kinase PknB [Rosistilla oblonga]